MPIVRWEAEALRDAGYRVSMSTMAPKQGTGEHIPGIHLKMLGLITRRLPKHPICFVIKYVEFTVRSIVFGLKNRSDLYVAHDIDTAIPGYILSKLTGARLVYYSIELYAERPGVPLRKLGRLLDKWFLKRVDTTIACEPNRAKFMAEEYGAPEPPLVVMNVPPYETPRTSTKLRDVLKERGIDASKIALYQGMISEIRCVREFIQAGKFLDDGIVLVIIGRVVNHPIEYWTSTIARDGVEGNVVLLPPVLPEDLKEITASADIGLQLQYNVGANSYCCAPIKLFQYLMAGLPVVACDFPGMRQIVEGEGVGICVSPKNPEQIAAAINRLCADEALYSRMKGNALRVAKEKYNWGVESRKILDLFERLSS